MAPLSVGDFRNLNSPESQAAWDKFTSDLLAIKKMGATAVSTDVWWGVIEGEADGKFYWDYYDKLSDLIIKAGLKWVPILSFHQCGGNVGDTVTVPLPEWIWTKYIGKPGIENADSLKYKSEQGNYSAEYVSPWGIEYVIEDYQKVFREFQLHFGPKAGFISEINISLGPAGELRYPSYNSHDKNAGYPTRGSLQNYSKLAISHFQKAMLTQYGSLTNIKKAWGNTSISDISQIGPPGYTPALSMSSSTFSQPISLTTPSNLNSITPPASPRLAESFFSNHEVNSQYGIDHFKTYNSVLYQAGYITLKTVINEYNSSPTSAFKNIPISGKGPGVHWLAGNSRYAELAAGLITVPSLNAPLSDLTVPYQNLLSLFKDISLLPNAPPIIFHFTCIEMDDGAGGPEVASLAQTLVKDIAATAKQLGIKTIKGENALAGSLSDPNDWKNINLAIDQFGYDGITILRMHDIIASPVATTAFSDIVKRKCNTILTSVVTNSTTSNPSTVIQTNSVHPNTSSQ